MPVPVRLADPLACEQFYDRRYAQGYMDDWPERKRERVRRILAQADLPTTGIAVDFGCGSGFFTRVLHEALPVWRVVGLDISRTAIELARRAPGGCEFHHVDDSPVASGTADFLFTHHVLEHVADLGATTERMFSMLSARSSMLHVLPCGNAGSFEHRLCRLRTDGIDAQRGGRFFYEDEGHLRRLTTREMSDLAGRCGFGLVGARYSHHEFEAIDWLTESGPRFVWRLCDPSKAADGAADRELRRIRRKLLPMALVKSVARRRAWWLMPVQGPARRAAKRWATRADSEWTAMQSEPTGSEMYLLFRRG